MKSAKKILAGFYYGGGGGTAGLPFLLLNIVLVNVHPESWCGGEINMN